MKKTSKMVFLASTGLLTVLMTFSAGMYIFNHEMVVETFLKLGHPEHVVYPLAIAKLLGLIALWVKGFPALKEWAYAGFFFNTLLAFSAHTAVGDGEMGAAAVAFVLVCLSYWSYKKRAASAAV